MFHKTVHKAWNLFKFSKQSPENCTENLVFSSFNQLRDHFDRSNALFDQLNRNRIAIKSSRDSMIIFLPFRLIEPKHQPIENIKNFEFSFGIFTLSTLWNNILQTQTSLLQPIHVYTYIYNTHTHTLSTI